MKDSYVAKSHDIRLDTEYIEWIQILKQRFQTAQVKMAVKVNSEQLLFNWQLGRDLVIRRAEEKWGKGVVEQVSLDLQNAFPGTKGFSTTNLWYMKKWYVFYTQSTEQLALLSTISDTSFNEIKLHQLGGEIEEQKLDQSGGEISFPSLFSYVPWRHHVDIITKCKTVKEALFYVRQTIENSWSRSALDDNLRAGLYHVIGEALTNFDDRLPAPQGKLAQEILKGNYDLGFVTLSEGYDETALEDVIEQRMTRFLLELGDGWAFVGRQKEIVIAGKTRKIDLLFYHIYLRCYVVIELKVKQFDPEYAGKLNFYVNAVNDLIRRESDNPTIGLLICKDMNKTEVQYAFQGIATPLGVATYDNVKIREVQEKLPTPEQIQNVIEQAEAEYEYNQKKQK